MGHPQLNDDPVWIRAQIEALTEQMETGRTKPWAVSDAPEPFVQAQMNGIFGIEIPITRIEGKWKVSQNRPEADRLGLIEGLTAEGQEEMAKLVEERGKS
jgi:transcriptional regulator